MASESWELASPNSSSHLLEAEHEAPPREGLPFLSTQASLPSQPSSMGQLLASYQIPVELRPAFQDYTPAEFGLVATSLEDLDSFLAELVYPAAPTELLIKARIRRMWRHCHAMSDPALQRKLWNPCLLAPWILSLGQLRMGRGYTASRIGRCRLRGSRTYSSPCASSCIPSSCNAKPHLAYVRLSQSIARIRYLRSPRLLICGKCGSNGPTPWDTRVPLIGRLHLANRMQLRHWHAWQLCWGIRM